MNASPKASFSKSRRSAVTETRLKLYVNDAAIYTFYHPVRLELGVKMSSTVRHRDPGPSMIFRAGSDGRIYWKDFGMVDQQGQDAISYVQHRLMLTEDPDTSRHDAVIRIWDDLVLNRRAASVVLLPAPTVKLPYVFEAGDTYQPWELEYWHQHLVTERLLRFYNIRPARDVMSNGRTVITSRPGDPAYLYLYRDEPTAFKSYRPLTKDKADKFRGQRNGGLIEGYEQLPRTGEHLIITKATKDVAVLRRAGYIACAPTSENSLRNIIGRMEELSQRFQRVIILFDPDKAGMANAAKLQAASCWRWDTVFLPGAYNYPKDPADCVRKHGNYFWLLNFLSNFDLTKYHV